MNSKKYIGAFVLSFALLLASPHTNASANEANIKTEQNPIIAENENIEKLPNFDMASKMEIQSYKEAKEISKEDSDNLLSNFGDEYQTRLELAKEIKLLEKYNYENKDLIKESYKLLNSYDFDKIINQIDLLSNTIDEIQKQNPENTIELDKDEEKSIEDSIKYFLKDGFLIYEDNKENEDLNAFIEAIKNSKSYYLADDDSIEKYDQVIDTASKAKESSEAYDLLYDFIKSSDKESFDLDKYSESTDISNKAFTASNSENVEEESAVEETTIENPSQATSNETSTNSESAFLKNDKTSAKYNELSDSQKRELDAIDTNKDGKISKDELDNSANYTSNLSEDSWIYPFTEEALSKDNSENSSSTSDDNNTSSNKAVPKTVTIDDEESNKPSETTSNTDDNSGKGGFNESEDSDKTQTPETVTTENTSAASVVKTGIEGSKIVIAILLIALIAYYFMVKDKDKKNK
ncbi:hypothetical protein [uncultured Anaerococcus sp.]|uniref:hypothetical protein n=1 Tax=uncultured Anaerococcus sp. TaxID=293428 RepID=UPI00263053BA|nr:hypothetical protein [uncultured Anaerococcus sp.]